MAVSKSINLFLFLSNQQTKELISEIEIESKVGIPTSVVKTVRGGKNPSTYACEELMLAYAMWISPKFHLIVLRAFLNLHKNSTALFTKYNYTRTTTGDPIRGTTSTP